jgi:hypothetical protein
MNDDFHVQLLHWEGAVGTRCIQESLGHTACSHSVDGAVTLRTE